MEEKQLTPSTVDLIPEDGGGPPIDPWWQRVWQRASEWFNNVSRGGIYDTKVDRTHYDRWWWSWHLISDSSEIMGDIYGWASRVYDYFENWINPAREQLSEKVGRIQQIIREAPEGGFWGGVKDTFDTWGATFASFRSNPATFIYDRLPQWIKDLYQLWLAAWNWIYARIPQDVKDIWNNAKTWWDWVKGRWDAFKTQIGLFLDDPAQYIYDRIPLWVKQIWWNAETWWTWLQGRWDAFTTEVGLFIDNPRQYIYDHIPLEYKQIWWNAKTWWDWLNLRWDAFTKEIGLFIDDPYGYLTEKLEPWRKREEEYIFGIINDLFTQFANEIILKVMDWMSYVAPPIEAIDEMGPHFSSFTDILDEWAKAWKELKEAWVKEAMVMMKAFAAELRGEEEMELLTPSETILQYWQMLTPEQIQLIVSPPIKG